MLAPLPNLNDLAAIHRRLQRLEAAVLASLTTLETIVSRLEAKLGGDFLPEDLRQLLTDADLSTPLQAIDQLVRQGQHPAAAREVRDLFQVSWDEAHALVKSWNGLSRAEQLRAAKLARFLHRLDESAPEGT